MWTVQWRRSHEFTEFHQCDCRQHFKQVYIAQCITETLAVYHSKTLKINNVDKMLLLGLPQKQNGCPIGYIMLLWIISPLKRGVRRL